MKLHTLIISVVIGLISLSAQAQQQSSPDAGVYGRGNALINGSAQAGTVIQVRRVRIEANSTAATIGRGTGAALGGVLGAQVGKGTAANVAGGILGALVGGVAGDIVTDKVASNDGTEIVVAMADGRAVVVTQAGESPFGEGSPVYVIQTGGTVRIVARTGSAPAAAPQSFGGSGQYAPSSYSRRSF